MKKNNLFFRFTALALLASAFMGCNEKDDPTPVPPQPLKNAIEFAGTQTGINSIIEEVDEQGEMAFVYLAADEGITSSQQLIGSQREYAAFGLGEISGPTAGVTEQEDRITIDLTALQTPFRVTYAKGGKTLLEVSDQNRSAISAGTLTVREYDEYDVMEFTITLGDGTLFRGNVILDGEDPVPPMPDLNENTILLDGREIAIRSAFAAEYADYATFTVSPAEGITSLEQIAAGGVEYLQLIVLPSLLNQTFDPLTEQTTFSIISTLDGAEFEVGAGATEALELGRCTFNLNDLDADILLHLSLADGTVLSVRAAGKMAAPMPQNENYITRDGVKKPLRAAFFDQEDDMVMLWFTPGGIEWFEDITVTSYFATLLFTMDALNGNTINLGDSDRTFQIYLTDNSTEETKVISSDDLGGATGSFRIGWDEETETFFDVELNVTFGDGSTLEIDFDGECKWMGEEPVLPNEFTYNGTTREIRSAIVDKRNSPTWDIWFTDAENVTTVEEMMQHSPVHISCPKEAFDVESTGFSMYDDLYFEYDGKKWSGPNGNVGTLSAYIYSNELELDFTNYESLKGHYVGNATVITM